MYDPDSDELRPLAVLARQIPNRSGTAGVNASSVWRWTLKGLKGRKLRTQFCGGIRMSSGRWLAEFFASVTAVANGEQPIVQTAKQRERAVRQAEAELEAAGI
jgi:hypothetical protein